MANGGGISCVGECPSFDVPLPTVSDVIGCVYGGFDWATRPGVMATAAGATVWFGNAGAGVAVEGGAAVSGCVNGIHSPTGYPYP